MTAATVKLAFAYHHEGNWEKWWPLSKCVLMSVSYTSLICQAHHVEAVTHVYITIYWVDLLNCNSLLIPTIQSLPSSVLFVMMSEKMTPA